MSDAPGSPGAETGRRPHPFRAFRDDPERPVLSARTRKTAEAAWRRVIISARSWSHPMHLGGSRLESARSRAWPMAFAAAALMVVLVLSSPGATAAPRGPAHLAPAIAPLPACAIAPTFSINGTPLNGSAPLVVHFTSSASGGCGPYQIEWEFGDGGEAEQSAPSHTYNGAGTFEVLAHASGANNSSASARLTVHVTGGTGPVSVSVTAAPSNGPVPLVVTAWANVTGANVTNPQVIHWTFGDGGTGTGSPVRYTYRSVGTFTANATYYAHSAATTITTSAGVPSGPSNLSITASPSTVVAPGNVTVTAESNAIGAPFNLTVCYGDGSACDQGPPAWPGAEDVALVHAFLTSGVFSIVGTISNASGLTVASASTTVNVVAGPALNASATSRPILPTSAGGSVDVVFIANVTGGTAPYSVQWTFGDGLVGASLPGEAITHTYSSSGTSHAFVSVEDAAGNIVVLSLGAVTVTTPSLGFLPSSYGGVSTPFVLGLLAVAAIVVGWGAGRWALARTRGGRLRQEGEQLVRELQQRH